MSANIARPIPGYRGFIEICRARAVELGISRSELDRISGLPAGYSGRILGNYEAAKEPRRMWPASLDAILGTLGLRILIIEDEAAAARTIARREPVDRTNQRFGNVCRISATLLPPPPADASPAPQPNGPPALSIVRAGTRRGGKYG
jgi:hypothetical protein